MSKTIRHNMIDCTGADECPCKFCDPVLLPSQREDGSMCDESDEDDSVFADGIEGDIFMWDLTIAHMRAKTREMTCEGAGQCDCPECEGIAILESLSSGYSEQ
jgi:hypothetical protein